VSSRSLSAALRAAETTDARRVVDHVDVDLFAARLSSPVARTAQVALSMALVALRVDDAHKSVALKIKL